MFNKEKLPELAMKLGTKKAWRGEKTVLDYPPLYIDGRMYIPTSALTEGVSAAETVTLDGKEYATELKGGYAKYDSIGIIMVDRDESILEVDHSTDLEYILRVIGSFIFDIEKVKLSEPYAPATDGEREGFRHVGADVAERLRRRNSSHPRLFASQELFDKLKKMYEDGIGNVKATMDRLLADVHKRSENEKFAITEDGSALVAPLTNPDKEDGYDVGGRHHAAESLACEAMYLAFGYRITGEVKLARQAYLILDSVMHFTHWGPGHFLNCSGAALYSSVAYDWLYEVWSSLKLDTGAIKRGIFTHGILEGYNSVIYDTTSYPSARQGTGWRFKLKRDNWNAVCNAGLITASINVIADGADEYISEEELAMTVELLGGCLSSVTQDGFVLRQYAPDGSYVESNSYWCYGTTSLFRIIAVLYDTLGTDLGISLAGGVDRTCYYCVNAESADYVGWNYHDGSLAPQDSSIFNMLATVSGDDKLYALRRMHLERGKVPTPFDMLYWPELRGRSVPEVDSLALDYYMEGIDGFTVRDGWSSGSLYCGIMGGYNPDGGSHNQLDSGSFVYHNKGVMWFTDMGPDNYNTPHYFNNYALYRRSAEGNNTLICPAIPYGQAMGVTAKIITHGSDTDGAYAVIDNTVAYGALADRVLRGMLLTNDRKTLVIQDEADFSAPTDAYWVAHYTSDSITAEISDDGKSCVMTHTDGAKIKVTLIANGARLEIRDCYEYLLPTTEDFEGEHSRNGFARLVIAFKNATRVRCSVVIEELDENGYTSFVPMSEWH